MHNENSRPVIGLIVPNLSGNFSARLISLLNKGLEAEGYQLVTAVSDQNAALEIKHLDYFSKTADGILNMSAAAAYEEIKDHVPNDIPTIFINRKPEGCPCTTIIENCFSAVYDAIINLTNNGIEHIACICRMPKFSTTQEITRAYKMAMSNLPEGEHDKWIYYINDPHSEIKPLVEELLEQGCEAFFAGTQTLTDYLLDYEFAYHALTGKHFIVSGFSNRKPTTALEMGIDTVAQPMSQLVDLAVQQIIYLIRHPDTPPKEYLIKANFRIHTIDPFHLFHI